MLTATPQVLTTVSTPASSYALTTLVNVKAELGITDGASDTLLNRYIVSASAAAAQYCNRKFQVESIKDEFWPYADPHPWQLPGGSETLQLSKWPVVEVTSVTERDCDLTENQDFRVDYVCGSLLRLDPCGGLNRWGGRPIVVQYSGGFAAIPPDVEDAVIRMVKSRYQSRDRDPLLRSENIVGVYEAQYWIATGSQAGNMTPDITDILDNYRPPVTV